ncbi:histone-lysine N-methyltransferase SETMAR [Trichonephila clavipes]|nr:histone-lysine N-methyltransferase SETMAR [Trichonephila clavipes]
MTVWWFSDGLNHHTFLSQAKPSQRISIVMKSTKCNRNLHINSWHLVNKKSPILLPDNSRPHVSMTTRRKMHALSHETLAHPPYSPDLSPMDYQFFKNLDEFL